MNFHLYFLKNFVEKNKIQSQFILCHYLLYREKQKVSHLLCVLLSPFFLTQFRGISGNIILFTIANKTSFLILINYCVTHYVIELGLGFNEK